MRVTINWAKYKQGAKKMSAPNTEAFEDDSKRTPITEPALPSTTAVAEHPTGVLDDVWGRGGMA